MDIFGFGNPFHGLGTDDAELELLKQLKAAEVKAALEAEARGDKGAADEADGNIRWINTQMQNIRGKTPPYVPKPWERARNPWTGIPGSVMGFGEDLIAPPSPASIKKTLKAMSELPMPMRRSSAGIIEWLRKPEAIRRAVSFIKMSMKNLTSGKYNAAASSAMSAAILAGRASEEDSALASRIINTAKALMFASLKRQKKI